MKKMYEVFVHIKNFIGKEPKAVVSFELPEKEWEELEKTEAWQSVERFLRRKKEGIPSKFDVLKAITDEEKFSDMVLKM